MVIGYTSLPHRDRIKHLFILPTLPHFLEPSPLIPTRIKFNYTAFCAPEA